MKTIKKTRRFTLKHIFLQKWQYEVTWFPAGGEFDNIGGKVKCN